MNRHALMTCVLVAAASCTSNDPIAMPDAGQCGKLKELDCVVTVECDGATSHMNVTLCDLSNDGPKLEDKARAEAAGQISCSAGASLVATCTAAPDAITCPLGFELEAATVCLPGHTYDADTAGVCAHLPATDDECGHACDRSALYRFTTDGVFKTKTCETTDGVQFVVGVAPEVGDGAR